MRRKEQQRLLDHTPRADKAKAEKTLGRKMLKTFTAAAAALLALAGAAAAQDYPTRTIAMVIPFAAGGPTDVLGRVVAARMSDILDQQIVVENIGGAGGMLG